MTITEVHCGPAEAGGQWFEVRNNDDSDGNNLIEQQFLDADGTTFDVINQLIVREGERVVLAAPESTIEADARLPEGFDLPCLDGALTLFDHTRGDVDVLAWSWPLDPAFSWSILPGIEQNAWANDLAHNGCLAVPTPGADNPGCPGDNTDDDGDGLSEQEGDCDDQDPEVRPGAFDDETTPDDADCDRVNDDGVHELIDADLDGTAFGADCDDADPGRAPGLPEVPCDGVDQDCDSLDTCEVADSTPPDVYEAPPAHAAGIGRYTGGCAGASGLWLLGLWSATCSRRGRRAPATR